MAGFSNLVDVTILCFIKTHEAETLITLLYQ